MVPWELLPNGGPLPPWEFLVQFFNVYRNAPFRDLSRYPVY